MKKEDIPQEPNEIWEGETKGVYAVSKSGKIEISQTSGWEVELIVLEEAISEIDRLSSEALQRVKRGESSTLEYHMYAQRMDLLMLAQAMGKFQWQIKRHFKPKIFSKLNNAQLEQYASVLDISVKSLCEIPDE